MQLVIFDIDGTLTRTNEVDAHCFQRALAEEVGIATINTHWSEYTHVTDSGITRQIFEEQLGRAPSAEELARVQQRFVQLLDEAFTQMPDSFSPVAGAAAALQRLRADTDWAVAIATGSWRLSALLKLRHARIDIGDLPAAFADDSLARAEIVNAVLARARAAYSHERFDRIVYVGDAVWDVETARRLGLAFLGVRVDGRDTVLRTRGATHVIHDFADGDEFVRTLAVAGVPAGRTSHIHSTAARRAGLTHTARHPEDSEMERHDVVWQSPTVVRTFLEGVRGGVPFGAEQIEAMLRVIEARGAAVANFADLGCGSGVLAQALLTQYPQAQATLVDFSEPMLEAARAQFANHDPRPLFVVADLSVHDWEHTVARRAPFDAVVSGYAIHHLSHQRKRALYDEVFGLLAPGGMFVNVEHVASRTAWLEAIADNLMIDSLFAFQRQQGSAKSRAEVADEFIHRPDKAANILAPIEEQCDWLRHSGFEDVDCYFKVFELAVFGGRRPR